MSDNASQDNRLLQLIGPNQNDQLVLTHFTGHECLSADFEFQLQGISDDINLNSKTWLGENVSFCLRAKGQGERWFNGQVSSFQGGSIDHQHKRRYTLTVKPWFSALTHTENCRIFQALTVVQILQTVCKAFGFTHIDVSQLGEFYLPVHYSVMMNESYHAYLSRILAEAEIYYAFVHEQGKHTLTLYDAKSATPKTSTPFSLHYEDNKAHLTKWNTINTPEEALTYTGESELLTLQPKQCFALTDNKTQQQQTYYINTLNHVAEDVTHRTTATGEGKTQHYQNHFSASETATCYIPQIIAAPQTAGPQSAIVTGPPGKVIYTDEYARVKVHFHWDRKGAKNETSSCWLSVVQMQAGDQTGTQFIPRVGDEVIVDFLEGDINRPIVVGSAYNQENQPLYSTSSADKVVSGIKTQLMNGAPGHELRFDDTPGSEQLVMNSAGHYQLTINNDLQQTTKGDETLTLQADYLLQLLDGEFSTKANSIEINVSGSQLKLDASGVTIKPSGKLHLLADGVPSAQPVARVGDTHQCPQIHPYLVPHVGGPVMKGSKVVMIDNLPAARVGDPMQCVGGKAKIKKGAKNILVDNKPLAFMTSQSDHGGKIMKGSTKAFVGKSKPGQAAVTQLSTKVIPLKADDIADIIYDVTNNSFYAITTSDLMSLLEEAEPLLKASHALEIAKNQKIPKMVVSKLEAYADALKKHQKLIDKRNAAIVSAKVLLNQALKPMLNGPDNIEVREVIRYLGTDPMPGNNEGKPWYKNKRIYYAKNPKKSKKSTWFQYKIDKDLVVEPKPGENKAMAKITSFMKKFQDPTNGEVSAHKLKKAISMAMGKSEKSVDLGSFNWNYTWKQFHSTFYFDGFKVDSQAQLFRATSNGHVEASLQPSEGKMSISADGHASLALAQGKSHITGCVPSKSGYVVIVWLKDKHGKPRSQPVDLGAVRASITADVFGFAGACINGSVNLNLNLEKNDKNGYGLKAQGNNKPNPKTHYASGTPAKSDVDKNGLKANINAFVGVKIGVDTGTQLEWQNPDDLAEKEKQESDSRQLLAETACWKTLGKLDAGGSVAMGAGLTAGFDISVIGYKFVIRGHANVVCGVGASGDFGVVVEAKHIIHFVAFIYHKLRDHHFNFVGFIHKDALKMLINIYTHLMVEEASDLKKLADDGFNGIEQWIYDLFSSLEKPYVKVNNAMQLSENLNSAQLAQRLRYSVPEVKARLLFMLTDPEIINLLEETTAQEFNMGGVMSIGSNFLDEQEEQVQEKIQNIESAILVILSFIQCHDEYINVVQHMGIEPTDVHDQTAGEKRLYNGLGIYGRSKLQRLSKFKEMLDNDEHEVVYPKQLIPNTAFKRNMEIVKI